MRHRQRSRDSADLVDAFRGFDEGNVRASLNEALGPLDGAVEPLDRPGVGAGDDQEVVIHPRVDRCLDLGGRLGRRDHRLAVEVPAFLRHELVFQLDRVGAGTLERAHGVPHVEGAAETGVGVDDDGQLDRVARRGRVLHQVGQADKAEVGHAIEGIGDACTGEVHRLEAELLDEARAQRVGRASHHQTAAFIDLVAKYGAGAQCVHL